MQLLTLLDSTKSSRSNQKLGGQVTLICDLEKTARGFSGTGMKEDLGEGV